MPDVPQPDRQEPQREPSGTEVSNVGPLLLMSRMLLADVGKTNLLGYDPTASAWLFVQSFDQCLKLDRSKMERLREDIIPVVTALRKLCISKVEGTLSEDFLRFLDGAGQ